MSFALDPDRLSARTGPCKVYDAGGNLREVIDRSPMDITWSSRPHGAKPPKTIEGKQCATCKGPITDTRRVTCSEKCRRVYEAAWHREYGKKKREEKKRKNG